jgi:FkbM family methyltransferase
MRTVTPGLRSRALQPVWRRLHALALSGMNYGDHDHSRNGELWLLDRLANHLGPAPVIFDVGANVGRYSMEVLRRFPNASLYAFEPSATAYEQLTIALGRRARTFRFALGSEDAERALYANHPGSELGSLIRRDLHRRNIEVEETETVQVRRLDTFCSEHGIDRIDLLKIDTEGSELAILLGAESMLGPKTSFIQFEFGGTGIDAHTMFRDFFDLLEGHYVIHRLLPGGLQPLEYSERIEVFLYANYVAVPRYSSIS